MLRRNRGAHPSCAGHEPFSSVCMLRLGMPLVGSLPQHPLRKSPLLTSGKAIEGPRSVALSNWGCEEHRRGRL
eukprot:651742-Pleurochrysis_carterae.AAC.2